ncbi:glycoside hydrolase family 43 protein [Carboxylicivirga linearis]|uniref:Glycoside hydrolase family 43 protein n=1 Tax=Carboxylicivirga linearis TaxID=1628157 RepID=A0ABS5JX63_9BACT|nr:glycoside hydrolase family 43 protein [Carboxylicivirga linearis]MBS2099512.1 glycoside hydrolase family 43 protein [Carboxylicivirga linearis]
MKLLTTGLLTLAIIFATSGCCQQEKKIEYINPVVPQRADPWVVRNDNGGYYMISTSPEYDRIEILKSKTINGLGVAEPTIVWRKHETGNMGAHIWAPELHRIDGKWYIYFAAGDAENVWNIRMYALSNDSEDPTQGEWKEEGRIMTQRDSFSLDATVFEHNGKHYMIWAQSMGPENSSLVMSEMETPVKLTGPEIVITKPELEWETRKHNVNEGPAVIKRNGKIFVTYSASATNHNYCMGLLWADENADLMDVKSWNKSDKPVFSTNADVRRFGPGHNSFTIAEDGKTDVLIYHARVYKDIRGWELADVNRHTRARTFTWDENGFPDFQQELAD